MPEKNRQSNLREKISSLPKCPGVYLFKDTRGRVLYIGKAKDLRSRVSSYFQESVDIHASRGPAIADMVRQVTDVDYLECDSEVEALLEENRLIKDTLPPFNERLTDDKSFPYLEVTTRQAFPGVYVTRKPRARSKLFGPFVNVRSLRSALQQLQRIFKFRTCQMDIAEDDAKRAYFRPCLLYAIDQCTAPCAAKISKAAYRADVRRLIKFLSSKRSVALRQIRRQMNQASKSEDFETAAKLRDQMQAIESLSLSGKPDVHLQPEVFFPDPREGVERLADVLKLDSLPRIIEGFDIANIQGEQACGSLVCFIDGVPFKAGYKRYKIKTVDGIDDCAMLKEVIIRRYRHAADNEQLCPDLVLVDGGTGQLNAALDAFDQLHLAAPHVISLAKKQERIFAKHAPDQPIKLTRTDPALKLVQYVRDEAHRFAQHYHHILRRKKVLGQAKENG